MISNKIEEALVNYWGKPCTTFEFGCGCCQAWGEYQALAEAAWKNTVTK